MKIRLIWRMGVTDFEGKCCEYVYRTDVVELPPDAYTERVRKLEAVAEIATRVANTWREYPPFTFDEMDELRAALDRLDTLDKTKGEKS